MLNRFSNGDGTYSFDLEMRYASGGVDDTSISFTVAICGGATLLNTGCYTELKNSQSPYATLIQDPALVAPYGADICITYTSYTSAYCDINDDCTPADNSVAVGGGLSLPVDLSYFNGKEEKFKKVGLNWVTLLEENNDCFIVERSKDGNTFEAIGRVEGKGNTDIGYLYDFVDKSPFSGYNYYRLKQLDYDQSFQYSEVILVKVSIDMKTALLISPSIAKEEVHLVFNTPPKKNAKVEVFSIHGLEMMNAKVEEGLHSMDLDISDYLPGTYYVRVPIEREYVVKTFVKVGD